MITVRMLKEAIKGLSGDTVVSISDDGRIFLPNKLIEGKSVTGVPFLIISKCSAEIADDTRISLYKDLC